MNRLDDQPKHQLRRWKNYRVNDMDHTVCTKDVRRDNIRGAVELDTAAGADFDTGSLNRCRSFAIHRHYVGS